MNRIRDIEKSVFGTTGSTSDANRLYSILLDTRASSVSESMYDIAEKLMKNEKDNAKMALEQLWALKKNLTDDNISNTVDMLIDFYQEKLDVLRSKEEHIKKVSKDSRELLEEKRKRDAEVAMVKQEITDCTSEVERLNNKMAELKVKEQELTLIGGQVEKELQLNANEVVNGLYEIILAQQEDVEAGFSLDKELQNKSSEISPTETDVKEQTPESDIASDDIFETQEIPLENKRKAVGKKPELIHDDTDIFDSYSTVLEKEKKEIVIPFPKSVVKTTRGVVIGEYYYDAKVYKNKRHYIYNSDFFRKRLLSAVTSLIERFDKTLFGEAMQMIQDAYKRLSDNSLLHFEVATNEILNKSVLKQLWQKMSQKEFNEISSVCNRLKAKIEMLGNNRIELFTEQMARYSEI